MTALFPCRFVGGVINRERVPAFERMLWRISRGNVFLRQTEIEKPLEDPATVSSDYFFIFYIYKKLLNLLYCMWNVLINIDIKKSYSKKKYIYINNC